MSARNRAIVSKAATFLIAFSLWLFARPFTFEENDGRIYAFMATAWGDRARFASDLFLKFGSQDAFSVFSPIFGFAIRLFGMQGATMGLLVLGGGLWICGSWRLLGTLLPPERVPSALFFASALRLGYGGFNALYVGEGFLTSRIFAEAIVMGALAELGRDRLALSGLFTALASALHPLMALAGAGAGLVAEAMRRPWLAAGVVLSGLLVLVFAAAGSPPFETVLRPMTGSWLEAVRSRNGFVFVGLWSAHDFARLLADLAIAKAAAAASVGWPRRFFAGAALAAAAGVAAAVVGDDLLHSHFLIQVQPWRLMWPLAWAAVPGIVGLAPKDADPRAWLAPALFALAVLAASPPVIAGAAVLGLVFAHVAPSLPRRLAWVAVLSVGAVGLVELAFQVRLVSYLWSVCAAAGLPALGPLAVRRAFSWWLAAPLAVLLYRAPRLAPAAGVATLTIAAFAWDQRSPWARYVMAGNPPLAASGSVLWGMGAADSWFLLKTPAFVSLEQASGLLFSPKTAEAWLGRVATSQGIVPNLIWRPDAKALACADLPVLNGASVRAICREPDRPDLVILDAPVPGMSGRAFSTSADKITICSAGDGFRALRRRTFYAYACHEVERRGASRAAGRATIPLAPLSQSTGARRADSPIKTF